ncbi:hypothetical protein ACTXT7_006516 [Hymenolepis weldensis]
MEGVFGHNYTPSSKAALAISNLRSTTMGDLYDFTGVVNFHCDRFCFSTFTEEKFNYLFYISGLQTNLTHDSDLIDSDAIPMRLVHKKSASMPSSAQFVARPNPSTEQMASSSKEQTLNITCLVSTGSANLIFWICP